MSELYPHVLCLLQGMMAMLQDSPAPRQNVPTAPWQHAPASSAPALQRGAGAHPAAAHSYIASNPAQPSLPARPPAPAPSLAPAATRSPCLPPRPSHPAPSQSTAAAHMRARLGQQPEAPAQARHDSFTTAAPTSTAVAEDPLRLAGSMAAALNATSVAARAQAPQQQQQASTQVLECLSAEFNKGYPGSVAEATRPRRREKLRSLNELQNTRITIELEPARMHEGMQPSSMANNAPAAAPSIRCTRALLMCACKPNPATPAPPCTHAGLCHHC